MKLFLGYLTYKWKEILAFVLFSGLFFLYFVLCHLPLGAVLYPAVLCAALGLFLLWLDLGRVKKTHRHLRQLAECPAELMDDLPPAGSLTDEDYQALLCLLREEQRRFGERAWADYRRMMDYYTLWAHQIKTPIASMRLNLQNEDSPLSRQLQNDLNRVEQYADMVLAFLRLDSASTDYVFRTCDLDTLVRGCVKKFAGEFIARKLSLSYTGLDTTVLTDEKWLAFVVEQVLSNALKYTREGSISIYLEEPKTLCIRDTGIGIAPQDLPRIFDQGFTGFNGREDKRASGIGLYLCRRVCDNLGCTITAQSRLGEGTLIRIDLDTRPLQVE